MEMQQKKILFKTNYSLLIILPEKVGDTSNINTLSIIESNDLHILNLL